MAACGSAVEATPGFARALGTLTVVLSRDGQEVARTPGGGAGGHPLDALALLLRELARQGRSPRPGEYLGIGGFAPPVAAAPGEHRLSLDGLPGARPVVLVLE